MKFLSFKYKFILSFVIVEMLFISLIVFFNFSSLKNLSHSLINSNIESSSKLFVEVIKTPLIINDLATIDNALESFIKMKYIVAVRILNNKNMVISHLNDENPNYKYILNNKIENIEIDKEIFQLKILSIEINEEKLAEVGIIYELSDIYKHIEDNRNMTFFLIILEILLSTIIAYVIGSRLTKRLTALTLSAEEISKNNQVSIATDKNIVDEVSVLSNTLFIMQDKIFQRNSELEELIEKLEYSSMQLKKERDFHTTLINNSSSAIIVLNNKYEVFNVNETVNKLTTYSKSELKGKLIWDILKDNNMKALISNKNIIDYPKEYENTLISKYETNALYSWSNSFTFDEYGEVEYIISVGVDISGIKEIQKKLENYIKLVNENIIISRTNLEGKITDVSSAFCEISGFSSSELIGQSHSLMRHLDTPIGVYEDLWTTIKSGKIWKSEVKNKTKDGNFYWTDSTIYPDYDNNGNVIGYYSIRHDITNKKLIENLSLTDPLTKLYNRRHFDDMFYKEFSRAKRDRSIFCLLSLDVDYFKLYNDTYGHQEGDFVLQTISKILMQNMRRSSDLAFRMGGEEFSAIFTMLDEKNVYEFSENIRSSIENKELEHKKSLVSSFITVSIGVALVDFNKNKNIIIDKSNLYKYADDLLYKAKTTGRNRIFIKELE
jgi:diguanylate cyclase (GGDEF)-like protein/PAS domain S-box-containing protein